ncbi:MAG: PAS domain S-box protein [Nitrospira sp.]|nr:PAS domain S-box protein [bacterium]MBL7047926.1 PAS domain S-box protein [Nitrospira sp.]
MSKTPASGHKVMFTHIRTKMLVYFSILFISTFLSIEIINIFGLPFTAFKGDYAVEKSKSFKNLNLIADLEKEQILKWLDKIKTDSMTIAESPMIINQIKTAKQDIKELQAAKPEDDDIWNEFSKRPSYIILLQQLAIAKKAYKIYKSLQIIDSETHQILVSTDRNELGKTAYNDPALRQKMKYDDIHITPHIHDPGQSSGALTLDIHKSITDNRTHLAYLDLHIVSEKLLKQILLSGEGLGVTGETLIVDENARPLAPLKYKYTENRIRSKPALLASEGQESFMITTDYRGIEVLAAYRYIPLTSSFGWGMVVKQDREEIMSPIYTKIKHSIYLTLAGVIALAVFTAMIARNLSRPIVQMSRTARAIKDGDLSARVLVDTGDEVGILAETFNSMIQQIQDQNADLEQKVKDRTTRLDLANTELIASEERFRAIFEQAAVGVAQIDSKTGTYCRVNRKYCEITGYSPEELQRISLAEITHQDNIEIDRRQMNDLLEGRIREFSHEKQIAHKNSSVIWVNVTISPMWKAGADPDYHIEVLEDITAAKELEAQLLHAHKMEAVGQLAGGVAHEFNNILTAIINNIYLMQKKTDSDGPISGHIKSVMELSNNAARIAGELLTFSRKQKYAFSAISLNEIMQSSEKMLHHYIGADIDLQINFSDAALPVIADKPQIEQAIMNLATNARDAMPDGGTLCISTAQIEVDNAFAKANDLEKAGIYAVLCVTDTGKGISEINKKKVFEPFYTTKAVGEGTGLGLPIIYGIIKQHMGCITLKSTEGKGTTFCIYLPIKEQADKEAASISQSAQKGNAETILLAEDDESVRKSITTILESYNYKVLAASNGLDAIKLFEENIEDVKLVILDIVMPVMKGEEALQTIQGMKPDIHFIFTSGYMPKFSDKTKSINADIPFIAKPIIPDKFLMMISKMLKKQSTEK